MNQCAGVVGAATAPECQGDTRADTGHSGGHVETSAMWR